MEFPDIAEIQVGCSSSCDSGYCLDEVRPLAYRIDNCHDGIISSRLWEFHNEVHADDFPTFFWDRKGVKLSDWEMALRLGAEA
jgi:hypothetical protein